MEKRVCFGFPKKLGYEAKDAVGRHVYRPEASLAAFFSSTEDQQGQKNRIEDKLCLSGGPALPGAGDDPSETTSADEAVHSGACQRKNSGNRENVEDVGSFPAAELSAGPIEEREQKNRAEKTHVAKSVQAEALERREYLDA